LGFTGEPWTDGWFGNWGWGRKGGGRTEETLHATLPPPVSSAPGRKSSLQEEPRRLSSTSMCTQLGSPHPLSWLLNHKSLNSTGAFSFSAGCLDSRAGHPEGLSTRALVHLLVIHQPREGTFEPFVHLCSFQGTILVVRTL
jgi:hypothetical protein